MKTNLDKHYKTDHRLESEGVEFAIDDNTSFLLRRFNAQNPKVKAAMAMHYKPYARQVEMGTLPQEKSDEITRKLFIDVCLVSWKGILDDAGKPIEPTKENALELFKALPDLFDTLWRHVNDFANYKEDVGNS